MKILKYILVAALIFILWVTEPLWMKKSYDTPVASTTDTFISEQKKERNKLLAAEAEKQKLFEDKFGKKPTGSYSTGAPTAVKNYWDKTLIDSNSLEEVRCGPIRMNSNGWNVVCRYRTKNKHGNMQLMQDSYIIKNGIVLK